jgi:selenocysteine lyase/cysteine desulfurase
MLSERGFCLRTGYHCAPLAHKAIGTGEGGALRASFSIFNTANEVDALCREVKAIVEGNF